MAAAGIEGGDPKFMQQAIDLAKTSVKLGGGPFGCVIVKDGKVIGEGHNRVTLDNDPTAHAEVVAIRNTCKSLSTFQIEGADLYTSCEPCPMCLGAIYWARPRRWFFACTRKDAADIGFDDDFIYQEIPKSMEERQIPTKQICHEAGLEAFRAWSTKDDKTEY